ncbi:MAG: metal-dependent hydrolase, partial [Alphaproteobacteria bacterium]
VLAHAVLSNPEILAGAHPTFRAIWVWHSIEETEHKAVAFDVYKTVMPKTLGTYLQRVSLFALSIPAMHARFLYNWTVMMRKSGHGLGLKNWGRLAKFLFGRKGLYAKTVPLMLDYFRPSFHPWDHDNRELLSAALISYGNGSDADYTADAPDATAIAAA